MVSVRLVGEESIEGSVGSGEVGCNSVLNGNTCSTNST